MDLTISPEQEHQWRTQGFTVVDGFDVSAARAAARFDSSMDSGGFGSKDGGYEIPSGTDPVDLLPFRVLKVAKQLLRCNELMLSQADVWLKKTKPHSEQNNND